MVQEDIILLAVVWQVSNNLGSHLPVASMHTALDFSHDNRILDQLA